MRWRQKVEEGGGQNKTQALQRGNGERTSAVLRDGSSQRGKKGEKRRVEMRRTVY